MAFYKITYGCGCGDNEEYMIFNSEQEANSYAYEKQQKTMKVTKVFMVFVE